MPWRWVSLQSTYFQKGWVSSCGRRHEISLGKKREKSAPVEERSLSIARLRAPTCRQTASLLQRLSKRICQHSLPEIILPIVSLSIQISCDCLQFYGPIEILVAHNFFIGNYFVTFLIIGLLAAGVSLFNKPKPLRISEVSEAFFSYYLLFAIGINNLINFVFHVFFDDVAAKFIGWENSPVQAEVGFECMASVIAGSIRFKATFPFPLPTF